MLLYLFVMSLCVFVLSLYGLLIGLLMIISVIIGRMERAKKIKNMRIGEKDDY